MWTDRKSKCSSRLDMLEDARIKIAISSEMPFLAEQARKELLVNGDGSN